MGTMEIRFNAPNGRPLDPKSPDQYPPFLVARTFLTRDAVSCPAFAGAMGSLICTDTWVGTLTPL